jgi:hypothetical protein
MLPEASHWNGDEWRWHRWNAPAAGPRYISVIEPAQERDAPEGARRIPFGFSRVLQQTEGDREPLLWEGD